MVLALFFGVEVKGSRRWISLGSLSIQPSEFMKPAFVIICAWLFSEHARQPEIPGNLFAIILFGIVVERMGFLPVETSVCLNQFVYWIGLPTMLFHQLARMESGQHVSKSVLTW